MDLVSQNLLLASSGKKDPTFVDDVFSTYLWRGDGRSGRSINNNIKLSNDNAGNGVDFDYVGDYLNTTSSSSDFTMGTGDFTVECWVYIYDVSRINGFWQISPTSGGFDTNYGNTLAVAWDPQAGEGWQIYGAGAYNKTTTNPPSNKTWYHTAYVRSSGTSKLYINGTSVISQADTYNYNGTYIVIGGYYSPSYLMDGVISNLRVVKGTALYTSNFTPPTKALTSVTNTKLLCCNKSTTTGATVNPVTFTVNGNPNPSFGPFTGSDGKGGLAWIKSRSTGNVNVLFDTVRGANQRLRSDSNLAQNTADLLQPSFTNSGFTVGSGNEVNGSGNDYTSWTFRKQKGFFDIVTWTGNDSVRTISHSLGCVPGLIMVKGYSNTNSWYVYHRDIGPEKYLRLNGNDSATDQSWFMNDTAPTASEFSLGTSSNVNGSGQSYVAYLFAGGASTATGASSCSFNGTSGLDVAASSAVNFGTGTFCVEAWVYVDNLPASGSPSYGRVFQLDGPTGNNSFSNLQITINPSNNTLHAWAYGGGNPVAIVGSKSLKQGFWNHIAVVRDSNNLITQYVNGIPDGTVTTATNFNPNSGSPRIRIGYYSSGNGVFDGKISNLRVTVGEPVYTAAFRPSTEPLTTTSQVTTSSNVKLLCCNVISNATGSTVTPGAIGNNGTNPVAYGNNPFDDPAGFKFGEEGDQNIIKTGSYVGNSTANHEIYVGWEPQWWLVKNITDAQNWQLLDSMRGWISNGNDMYLVPNNTSSDSAFNFGNPTATGFNLSNASSNWQNESGKTYAYIAIRRPDGLVGKPPAEVGTDVFAMDTGAGSTIIPNFDANFPVDFAIMTTPNTSGNHRNVGARLIGEKYLRTNGSNAESGHTGFTFDSNLGWGRQGDGSNWQSWHWKRHAGFDVVTYKGNGASEGMSIPHSLGKVPEMIWVKSRAIGFNWYVYHFGQNSGTNPQNYYLRLNHTDAEQEAVSPYDVKVWNDTAPTSTTFSVGPISDVNDGNDRYIALLFASVEGISKVGYYNGQGSDLTIEFGFQPRFLMVKRVDAAGDWNIYDTTRGLGPGSDDKELRLNNTSAQSNHEVGLPTSTGFTFACGGSHDTCSAGKKFIYYAHA